MPWLQCTTPFPGDFDGIQDPFEPLFAARGKPANMALFCRNADDSKSVVFLLSPVAAELAGALGGEWAEAKDLKLFDWSLLVGSGTPHDYFGLRSPSVTRQR